MRAGVRLGVDVGSVRIGIARSDPRGVLASPLATVRRGRGDLDEIAALAAEHRVAEVIVGLPSSLSGREGRAAAEARKFAAALARLLTARLAGGPDPSGAGAGAAAGVPGVRLFDERFSTVTAHGALREGGRDERARRPVVDQAAAAVLLQAALDTERSTGQPPGELIAADREIP
jgi:putative Holliday junction resolvase